MAKGKFGIFGAFTLGFGLGATAIKWWPTIQKKLTPVTKSLSAKGKNLFGKAKGFATGKSETTKPALHEGNA